MAKDHQGFKTHHNNAHPYQPSHPTPWSHEVAGPYPISSMGTSPPREPVDGAASQTASTDNKPINSLVLDTGPLIKNDPSSSALLSQAETLYTIPSVVAEIKDPATRARFETTLLPFITIRAPGPASVKFVTDFAKRTGDFSVLSRPDIEVIALCYELECERNNGDWRLRNTPGQKSLNGRPANSSEGNESESSKVPTNGKEALEIPEALKEVVIGPSEVNPSCATSALKETMDALSLETELEAASSIAHPAEEDRGLNGPEQVQTANPRTATAQSSDLAINDESDSDSDGWITPSNLKKHQAEDSHSNTAPQPLQRTLQAAILTSDYAMQNVALRINLNLVTPSFARITYLKNWVLRCHGCFCITKDMDKQFCPKCGQPTLTRASCSTDSKGNFQIHLKKNFQWNKRGNVYSFPKAVHGSANGRLSKGQGGQGGWGAELILAEDQKEYTKLAEEQRRRQKKDIMDEDYLPGILSGKRSGQAGKIRVGAGKNVNSKRKH